MAYSHCYSVAVISVLRSGHKPLNRAELIACQLCQFLLTDFANSQFLHDFCLKNIVNFSHLPSFFCTKTLTTSLEKWYYVCRGYNIIPFQEEKTVRAFSYGFAFSDFRKVTRCRYIRRTDKQQKTIATANQVVCHKAPSPTQANVF